MASQGPLGAGTGADDNAVGTITWQNTGNITAEDGTDSTASAPGAFTSHYLKATNFSFSIPTGATIDGLVCEFKRFVSSGTLTDNRVRVIKGGVIGATELGSGAAWATSLQYDTFGGSSNLCGETWTVADINASNFGFALSCTGNLNTAHVDYVRVTVYYTPAATTPDVFPHLPTSIPPRLRQTIEAVPY